MQRLQPMATINVYFYMNEAYPAGANSCWLFGEENPEGYDNGTKIIVSRSNKRSVKERTKQISAAYR